MKITPSLFQAYLKCPTKCWLRATGEAPSGNSYAEWVEPKNESYRVTEAAKLDAESPSSHTKGSHTLETLKGAK